MRTAKAKPPGVYFIMVLLLFQALSGLGGGLGLVADPTGKLLNIPAEWLEGSLFSTYLVPGLTLLIVLGVGPFIVCYRVWRNLRGSWFGAMMVGTTIIIWIAVEISVIGYKTQPPLQLIYSFVGVGILGSLFLPSVRKFYFEATPLPT